MNILLSQQHLLEKTILSPLDCLCQKSVVHICMSLFLNPLLCFMDVLSILVPILYCLNYIIL